MLCIRRRLDQSVMIGPDIVVSVLEIRSDDVLLGIAAPKEIRILREEVAERIARKECPDEPKEVAG